METSDGREILARKLRERLRASKYLFICTKFRPNVIKFATTAICALVFLSIFLLHFGFDSTEWVINKPISNLLQQQLSEEFEINNWLWNDHLVLRKDRQKDAKPEEIKTILMWNDAYGVRNYDIGHGREPFYKFQCPETRCYATANRSYLKSVDEYDAILIHQRGIEWNDMPRKRSPKQRFCSISTLL